MEGGWCRRRCRVADHGDVAGDGVALLVKHMQGGEGELVIARDDRRGRGLKLQCPAGHLGARGKLIVIVLVVDACAVKAKLIGRGLEGALLVPGGASGEECDALVAEFGEVLDRLVDTAAVIPHAAMTFSGGDSPSAEGDEAAVVVAPEIPA